MMKTVLLRRAGAGAVAAGAMSSLMLAAQRAGLLGGMPPERLTARTLDRAGIRRSRRSQDLLAVLALFGFGSAGGVLLVGGRSSLRPPLPGFLKGAVYGAGVWLVSYGAGFRGSASCPRPIATVASVPR